MVAPSLVIVTSCEEGIKGRTTASRSELFANPLSLENAYSDVVDHHLQERRS